jgi:CheY-like chemotaxis protein
MLQVDDNKSTLQIARLLLQTFGVGGAPCAAGPEAVRIGRFPTFDTGLMDLVMAAVERVRTLRGMREDPAGRDRATPVIAATAKLAADDMARYAQAGFDDVARKPINVRELVQVVAPFMAGAAAIMHPGDDNLALARHVGGACTPRAEYGC